MRRRAGAPGGDVWTDELSSREEGARRSSLRGATRGDKPPLEGGTAGTGRNPPPRGISQVKGVNARHTAAPGNPPTRHRPGPGAAGGGWRL